MFDLIRVHQLNIMLVLCGACATIALLLIITQFISRSRKTILILMEVVALLLLWFDRLAYIYSGNMTQKGYIMVRVSNFFVYFLTSAIVLVFTGYQVDLLVHEGGMKKAPRRLYIVGYASAAGMLMSAISAFTNLYYYFDEANRYHRGNGFLIAYIVPVICPLIQLSVIIQYRKKFSKLIFASLLLYIIVPISCGILQIFAYGISIVNMSMVLVSVSLYAFTHLDINDEVKRAHEIEMNNILSERVRLQRLFDQTANAFVSAVEKKDDFTKGNSARVAGYAKRIAELSGKSADDCEKVYYAALLHDVGMIGIPDSVIKNEGDPEKWDYEMIRQKPIIGAEILSSITEYPYLSQGARYSHERYNGTGYPEGLKGNDIPEIARIIGVADAYVTATSKKRYRDARPDFVVREMLVKGAGETFDPDFSKYMLKIIDEDVSEETRKRSALLETGLECGAYRDTVSLGILADESEKRISFRCGPSDDAKGSFSAPSIILFDSYDERVHTGEKAIKEYSYLEYGEIWFDDNMINNQMRKTEVNIISRAGKNASGGGAPAEYEIIAGKYEDHIRLRMQGPAMSKELIIVLLDSSKSAYIGITGENCSITDITVEPTGVTLGQGDIPRIAEAISYIDHLESDISNVQIDTNRSASTEGIKLNDSLRISFHTMSLPGASFIWHCPYIILFNSDDGLVGGENYIEHNVIKLNGESDNQDDPARNRFVMKKKDDFPGWEAWKAANKEGLDCEVTIDRIGDRVIIKTENLGISIESITTLPDKNGNVFVALSGDQCALTDIRIS